MLSWEKMATTCATYFTSINVTQNVQYPTTQLKYYWLICPCCSPAAWRANVPGPPLPVAGVLVSCGLWCSTCHWTSTNWLGLLLNKCAQCTFSSRHFAQPFSEVPFLYPHIQSWRAFPLSPELAVPTCIPFIVVKSTCQSPKPCGLPVSHPPPLF